MCGIISILSKNNNIKNIIINGLEQLQNRGYDSAGITYYNQKFNTIKYASTNEIRAIEKLKIETKKIEKFNLGIGHTRWATHGAKTNNNSHPHHSFDDKVILVHNGIIENFDQLKNKLIEQKITFKSETDTEVIANLIAFHYQTNNFINSIKITLNQLEGTWGLVIINTDTPNKLYCVRKGSPLLISQTEDFIMVSSELAGFNGLVSNYFILDGNDLCEMSLQDNKLELKTQQQYQLKDNNINNFNLSPDPFPHWTIKEIEEQYESSIRALSFGGRLLDLFSSEKTFFVVKVTAPKDAVPRSISLRLSFKLDFLVFFKKTPIFRILTFFFSLNIYHRYHQSTRNQKFHFLLP